MSGIIAATGLAFVAGVAEGSSVLKHCYQNSTNDTNTNTTAPAAATTEEGHDHGNIHEDGQIEEEGQHQLPSLVIPSIVYGSLALPMTLVGASPNPNLVARMTNLTLPEQSQPGLQPQSQLEESWSAPVDAVAPDDTVAQSGTTMEAYNESLAGVGNDHPVEVDQIRNQVHQDTSLESAEQSQSQSPESTTSTGSVPVTGYGQRPFETNKRRMMKLGLPRNGNGNGNGNVGGSNNNNNFRQQPLHPHPQQSQIQSQIQSQSPQNPAGGLDVQQKREENRRALAAMRERKAQFDKEQQEHQEQLLHQRQNQKQQNKEVINAIMEGRPIKRYMDVEADAEVEMVSRASVTSIPPPAAAAEIKTSSANKYLSPKPDLSIPVRVSTAGSSANGTLLDGRILPTKLAQNMRGLRIFLLGYSLVHTTIAYQIQRQKEEQKRQEDEYRRRAMGRDRAAIQSFAQQCTSTSTSTGASADCNSSSSNTSTCTVPVTRTGIAMRLVRDGKQLHETMRVASLTTLMAEAYAIDANANDNDIENRSQEQKPRETYRGPCTLPILCSYEEVHLPFAVTTTASTKPESSYQNMIWNQISSEGDDDSNMAFTTSRLKDLGKKLGEYAEVVGVTINIEDQIPAVIITTINEYTNRAREMTQKLGVHVPISTLLDIQNKLSLDIFNQFSQSTHTGNIQDGLDDHIIETDKFYPNMPWWHLGETEQDWNQLPVDKHFFFENRAVGALGDGSSILLESDLSTSLKNGAAVAMGRCSKRKHTSKRDKYVSSDGIGNDYCDTLCRAELNARKIQHVVQKKKKSQGVGEDLSLVHIFVGTNVEDVHDYDEGDEISKSDILPSENVYINSMDAIISNIVKGIHENEEKINISKEDDTFSIHPLSTTIDNVANEKSLIIEKPEQSFNVVDRLGRSIRQVGSFAIYRSALAIDSIGSTVRQCGSIAASPVIYAGARIQSLLSFRIQTPLRQTIHIYSDNIDIAIWLQENLKVHGFEVVYHSRGSNVSSKKSNKSIQPDDDDYVLFACSSDEATVYIASKEIAKTRSEARKKRIIAIVEDTKSRDTLAAFLNQDKDSALIVSVAKVHEELFASARKSLSKNKMTNNIKHNIG